MGWALLIKSLLFLLPPLLMGVGLVFWAWPRAANSSNAGSIRPVWAVKAVLGALLGLGLDSCLYFLWMLASGLEVLPLVGLELALAVALAGLNGRRWWLARRAGQDSQPAADRRGIWINRGLMGLFAAALLGFGAAFVAASYAQPYGDFDAYSMWNLRARIFFLEPLHWKTAFSPAFDWTFHPDYPLLVPLQVARLWFLLGEMSTRAPMAIAAVFTLGIILLAFAALSALRDTGQAALAGLLLLGTPWLLSIGTAQTAEAALAAFIFSTVVCLAFYARTGWGGCLALAGLAAGLAGWSKNEGLLWIVAAALAALVFAWKVAASDGKRQTPASVARAAVPFASGLALPLTVILIFKITLAPANDLFAGRELEAILPMVTEWSRYGIILSRFADFAGALGGWRWPIVLVLAAYTLLLWRRLPDRDAFGLAAMGAAVLVSIAGYVGIYLVTPHPLDWHLKYSADRLLFQFYPVLVFMVFRTVRSPAEVAQSLHGKWKRDF